MSLACVAGFADVIGGRTDTEVMGRSRTQHAESTVRRLE
jgi:hypothetical protein